MRLLLLERPGGFVWTFRAPRPVVSHLPPGLVRAPRSHVAGHRASTYVPNRPHVPAVMRECACQMRTGGCS